MKTAIYIALIRAINVGGRSLIPMAKLRGILEKLGYQEVQTYIQTGNVIFRTGRAKGKLAAEIEKALAKEAGFETGVYVLTPAELRKAAQANPFDPRKLDAKQRCHLIFLSASPQASKVKALLEMAEPEYRFAVKGKVCYYAYDRKYDGTRRRSIPFEKVLGVSGTARTWKVVDKLLALSA